MIVRITVVVLRLGALYFLWWGIQGSIPSLIVSTGSKMTWVAAITIALSVTAAAGLWFFARPLAAVLYPYETDEQPPMALDVDRLEVMIVQVIGLILIVASLQDVIFALYSFLNVAISYGLDRTFADRFFDHSWVGRTLISTILNVLLGVILIMKVDGVLAIFRKLRSMG